MAVLDLTKCDQVAKRELAYLHDLQIMNRYLLISVIGENKFNSLILPKLVKDVKLNSDFLEQV